MSELFVNLAAAWFVVVFFDPQIGPSPTLGDIVWLIIKFLNGIISLLAAKYLRERVKRRKR